MADAYEEDNSIAPEHAASDIGRRISWGGRAIDGIGSIAGIVPNALGASFSLDPGGAVDGVMKFVGMEGATAPGVLESVGISSFAPLAAGIVAAGEGLQVVDDLAHGEMKKAGKHAIVGSAKAGVVFLDGMTMGLAEIPSLLLTGKFLSTNVGNVVGQMLDGADKKTKTTSNLAAVGYTNPQVAVSAPPPAEPKAVAPYGMQPPPGGWAAYEMARRGQQVQQPGVAPAPVMSGNPRFSSAVDVARQAASANPQLGAV